MNQSEALRCIHRPEHVASFAFHNSTQGTLLVMPLLNAPPVSPIHTSCQKPTPASVRVIYVHRVHRLCC